MGRLSQALVVLAILLGILGGFGVIPVSPAFGAAIAMLGFAVLI